MPLFINPTEWEALEPRRRDALEQAIWWITFCLGPFAAICAWGTFAGLAMLGRYAGLQDLLDWPYDGDENALMAAGLVAGGLYAGIWSSYYWLATKLFLSSPRFSVVEDMLGRKMARAVLVFLARIVSVVCGGAAYAVISWWAPGWWLDSGSFVSIWREVGVLGGLARSAMSFSLMIMIASAVSRTIEEIILGAYRPNMMLLRATGNAMPFEE